MTPLTETVKLGTLVSGVIYRYPGFLIKTASTLDVLSGGRAYFGVGAAWYEREALGLGIPFPPLKQRFEQLEETLQIAQQMWTGQGGSFHGQHYHLNEMINQPQPLQHPHPPILIGGMGEQKTLHFVARYGDACNFDFGMADNNTLQHKLNVLRQHCADVGRDYNSIEKTAVNGANLGEHGEGVDALLERAHQLAAMGFTHLIYNIRDVYSLKGLELFATRIIPELAKL
jgi:alkanesulfonate monooxygenase SsuD/methylene tetrahydromethanopterin reductase-like flavin-dependent oxidoreductase (luciferase family)